MPDRELLRKIMYLQEWTQEELAAELGFTRSQVSKVINNKLNLRSAVRRLAERLLKRIEEN